MDLPTYTNIWRIEKRLYKLYDLRLPMPLPLVQIGVFLGVFVPWIVLLRFVGVPFASPWHVLYIVPPFVLTWLATRPVIEGKRLTELLISQSRYLTEPRTWCRLTPIREPREVVIVARVWRRAGAPAPVAAAERAAIKSRRKRRQTAAEPVGPAVAQRPTVVQRPAATGAPAVAQTPAPAQSPTAAPSPAAAQSPAAAPVRMPRPSAAAAPPPLAEYAAQSEPPAAPPKPWRRTHRDISHEDDVQPAAELAQPTATPHLDAPAPPPAPAPPSAPPAAPAPAPPAAPAPPSGKRALASGVRRPGAQPEVWHAAAPPTTRPDIPQQPPPPSAVPPPEREVAKEPQAPAAEPVWSPGEKRRDVRQEPPAAAEQGRQDLTKRDAVQERSNGEVGDKKVAGWRTSAPRPPEPRRRPSDTRPDVPAAPGTFGARQPDEAAPPPRMEPPRPWSEGLSQPSRPAPAPPPAPEPGPQPQQPVRAQSQPQQPQVPQPQPPAPAPQAPASTEQQAPPREVRSQPASPVRPRPLPPPPAPPPSGPAITPPDPEHEVTGGGLRRLFHAVGGGHGDVDADYEQRLQQPFHGTRHVVILGCTGGAGQTVTSLMLGHTFAQHNGEPVVAIDVNPGPGALARRTRSDTNETLTGLITRADQVGSLTAMRRYTSQAKSGLDVIAAGKNPLQALDDRDYALAIRTIDRFYSVTLLDAAAAVVARVLPYADQLVLVAPASADAPRAVAMTFEWLDGHGYEELRSRAVTVINGVSRRSMDDVEQAEAVARGRCRALVRIPWDDHLSMDRAPRNELRSLRTPTRRAYLALAGVVAGGFTVMPERYQEFQHEQEATR